MTQTQISILVKKETKTYESLINEILNEYLFKSIDEGLACYGNNTGKVILFHLKKETGVGKENLVKNIHVLHQFLEEKFGSKSQTLKNLILKKLHENLEK
ncbi:hypothetical protein CW703_02245 [Candidatus Bathyarchaeota archaeon]|nr:MAG: hypothetical protein CW703_02245 [Candidatus Bathyarchaeota archaeon]